MDFRVIVSAAGLVLAFSLAHGKAEVLAFDSTFAFNGIATIADPPVVSDDTSAAAFISNFEVQSAPSASHDPFDADLGTPAVTAAPELPTWATTLLNLTGFGR
jgi:hypothetical protein